MEKQELDALLAELSAQLRELGIPLGKHIAPQVEVNTRAQRRLGCCVCREGRFTIQVSARLLEDAPLLRATLLHELLHTCYGCQNHGKRWEGLCPAGGGGPGGGNHPHRPPGGPGPAPAPRAGQVPAPVPKLRPAHPPAAAVQGREIPQPLPLPLRGEIAAGRREPPCQGVTSIVY